MSKDYIIIALVAILVFVFYLGGLEKLGLEFEPDENFYYQSSRRMVETGDFTTPYFFEKERFEKPILYYWFISGSIKLFGLSWPAARGVSVLFSVLFLILLYDFCIAFYKRNVAVTAVLISASSLCFFRYARILLPESAFLFFLFAFLSLFIKEILGSGRKVRFILAYIALALAVLLKGPVALLLAFFTIFAYSKITKTPVKLKTIYLKEGVLFICIIVLPWFIRMIQVHGSEYVNHILFREVKQRVFLVSGAGWAKDLKHFFKGLVKFIPVVLYFYLPWSIFIPHALHNQIKNQKSQKDKAGIFLLVYAAVVFVFFSLIYEKHRHYMLYLTPALAVFIAKFLCERFKFRSIKIAFTAILIISITSLYFFGILVNRQSYTLDKMISAVEHKFEDGDLFAVGSLSIHPYLLEANVNKPALKMCINMGNAAQTREETWNLINRELFYPHPDKAFCLLLEEEYKTITFMPQIEKDIKIIGGCYVPTKPDVKKLYQAIIKRNKKLFWDSFRKKALFITNKDR